MARLIDGLSDGFAHLAAWLFFAIGAMITYEVVARYVFTAPTVWAEEMSQFLQIWATYLAAAYVLRHRHLIRIEAVVERFGPGVARASDVFSLLVICAFSAAAVVYGSDIVMESVTQGRATASMMRVPKWMTESAVPVGFGLLFAQAVVELARVFTKGGRS